MSKLVVNPFNAWFASVEADLAQVESRLASVREAAESEIASHANTSMLLDAASTTMNVERQRADSAERKLSSIRRKNV